ncbi:MULTISPECIES: GtrA family protein [unclassified Variovorax]|uniref:GtrA family protein n=1 Tax=unclassified Variovorax TaxID=663243 RepID=UPI002577857B|nr:MULTISPECIES: GtrA family protein [unclassified Variovorax]MDM0091504.1 GtrA family protein [Variovorax sp. J22G40]MDM0149702.1 GtrA family protein [Variovorax sp. J2P1-31]
MLKTLLASRFLRFGVVGVAGLLVDLAVLHLLAPWLGWYGARVVSFLAAATSTWWLNRSFTFRNGSAPRTGLALGREYLAYLSSMLGGAAINYAVYALTLHWVQGAVAPSLGVALGSCAGLVVNFAAARKFVFNDAPKGPREP